MLLFGNASDLEGKTFPKKSIALLIQFIQPRNNSINRFIWQAIVKIHQFWGVHSHLRAEVTAECCFTLFQAYKNVLETKFQC